MSRSSLLIALFLLIVATVGCSMLRAKRRLTWHVTLEVDTSFSDHDAAIKQTINLIERRLDGAAVTNFEVSPQNPTGAVTRIVVNLPDVQDRERLRNILTAGGKLEIDGVVSPPNPEPPRIYESQEAALASLNSGGTIPPNRRLMVYPHNNLGLLQKDWVVVESPVLVDGGELRNAVAVPETGGSSNYNIEFSLKRGGAAKLSDWTAANINRYLAVVVNEQVLSLAYVKSQISDVGVISGHFTKSSAEDLALVLKSGSYPAPVRFVEEGENR